MMTLNGFRLITGFQTVGMAVWIKPVKDSKVAYKEQHTFQKMLTEDRITLLNELQS